jgi:hypothetical protein
VEPILGTIGAPFGAHFGLPVGYFGVPLGLHVRHILSALARKRKVELSFKIVDVIAYKTLGDKCVSLELLGKRC